MSRYNSAAKDTSAIENKAGGKAYALNPELQLYSTAVTSMMSSKGRAYETAEDGNKRMLELIKQVDPSFVAKLAIYAREKMFLRSVPSVLLVELAKLYQKKGLPFMRKAVTRSIQRVDEITEILAYYQQTNSGNAKKKGAQVKGLRKLSKAVQGGIADAFNKFSEYQFAKYDRENEIKLRDALFLSHSKPASDEQAQLFKKIIDRTLETPYTWEVEISAMGQIKDEKEKNKAIKAKWEELVMSEKMGYMATMRNIRNILQADVSDKCIDKVCKYLANEKAVLNSKQLPFRFLSAYRELSNAEGINNSFNRNQVLEALEKAVVVSAQNVAGFDSSSRVMIACDVSGSMHATVSEKSTVAMVDIGAILGQILQYKCTKVITGIFGDNYAELRFPKAGILHNVMGIRSLDGKVGYSTNGHKALEYLTDKGIVLDKVMMFTDAQMWNSDVHNGWGGQRNSGKAAFEKAWREYKKLNKDAKLYLFDLAGHGNTPVNIDRENGVFLISGWSNDIFTVLENLEKGEEALSEIKSIEI
jgi:60 kDa SS-A/Ro ribonucleoprotein